VGARCAKWQVCRRKRAFQESCWTWMTNIMVENGL
jgi:hypothetical protein